MALHSCPITPQPEAGRARVVDGCGSHNDRLELSRTRAAGLRGDENAQNWMM
jgi:hypothetical protein